MNADGYPASSTEFTARNWHIKNVYLANVVDLLPDNDSEYNEIDAALSVLNDALQPSDAISPAAAANRINELIPLEDGQDVSEVDGFFWGLWEGFTDVAGRLPHDHPSQEKLVQVIEELNRLPVAPIAKGMKTHVWAELRYLGPSIREAWIGPESEKEVEESGSHWVGLNAFAARLLNAGLGHFTTSFPLWSMRDALEMEKPPGPLLDCHVAAAAVWIAYSGSVLFRNISNEELNDRDSKSTAGGPLYNGRLGLSSERWRFWIMRFRKLSNQLGREVQQAALDAAENMERLMLESMPGPLGQSGQ
ncbi:MAG: hypothetical protein M1840_007579 [Geoglossum simile]|nr:MAG: hypothetical protein M1840_007579 [Geoglossum simile]